MILGFLFSILFLLNLTLAQESAEPGQKLTVIGSVHLRSSEQTKSKKNVIGYMKDGDEVTVIEEKNNFVKVKTRNGKIGFIASNYLDYGDFDYNPDEAKKIFDGYKNDDLKEAKGMMSSPICGCKGCRKSSKYGMRNHQILKRRKMHTGCDLAAPKGTIVYASMPGLVKTAGKKGGYGNFIEIYHKGELIGRNKTDMSQGGGYSTHYAHLHKIYVKEGQAVKKGQPIGEVNSTGLSTGNHLHFEVVVKGKKVDPEEFIDTKDISRSCLNQNNLDDNGKTIGR